MGKIEINPTGVTTAKGFKAANTAAHIKYSDRDDMAMIYSEADCVTAGTFTRNVVKAAPVIWDRDIVTTQKPVRAVVINAGIANACTGKEGMDMCEETSKAAARALGCNVDGVLVASTGVIGKQLPMDKIVAGVEDMSKKLADTEEAGHAAARAIMTTDTISKEASVTLEIGGTTVNIGAMTKGSGMIHPDMCTMLCFITTDAAIEKALLQKALYAAVNDSFNMISVDGDTSTNDTCVVMANGLAGNTPITEEGEDYDTFAAGLASVTAYLARMMAGDGEGATALLEVKVLNADTDRDARALAKSVVSSSLVKAAVYGHDANWGRILCALGYSGVEFDPYKVDVYFESAAGQTQVAAAGEEANYSEEEATAILSEDEVTVICDMHAGNYDAVSWGCDLTHEYVNINADYRS